MTDQRHPHPLPDLERDTRRVQAQDTAPEQAPPVWQDPAVVGRTIVFLAVRKAMRPVGLGPRPHVSEWRSRCCATSWRSCAVRSPGRSTAQRTRSSWPRCLGCCRGSGGRRFWSPPARCCAGTASWSAAAGLTAHRQDCGLDAGIVELVVRLAEETAGGDTGGSPESAASWAYGCRPARSAASRAGIGSVQHRAAAIEGGQDAVGVCACKPQARVGVRKDTGPPRRPGRPARAQGAGLCRAHGVAGVRVVGVLLMVSRVGGQSEDRGLLINFRPGGAGSRPPMSTTICGQAAAVGELRRRRVACTTAARAARASPSAIGRGCSPPSTPAVPSVARTCVRPAGLQSSTRSDSAGSVGGGAAAGGTRMWTVGRTASESASVASARRPRARPAAPYAISTHFASELGRAGTLTGSRSLLLPIGPAVRSAQWDAAKGTDDRQRF
jgi:hypothetical protein